MIGNTAIVLGIVVSTPKLPNLQVVDNNVSIVSQNIERLKYDNNYNMSINALNYDGDDALNMNVTLSENLSKLNMIYNLSLKDDNLISISQELITTVTNVLYNLEHQPEIFPTFLGNIQLEYEAKNKKYLEIEITPNGNMKIFKISDEGKEIEGDFTEIDINIIKKEVELFYG